MKTFFSLGRQHLRMKRIRFKDCLWVVGSLAALGINAESTKAQVPEFRWSQVGPISGMICVRVHEDGDTQGWNDNFLCSNQDLGLRWSQAGAIKGMRCTRIHEDADPEGWNDNFLCLPSTSALNLSWSQAGSIPGKTCTRVHEDADTQGWDDNFLCVGDAASATFPITGKRNDPVGNGRMETSFTLTADGRLTAVTSTSTKVKLKGFTGATSVVLVDGNKQLIWASDVHSYGVDGCLIGRCSRNSNWSDNVPSEIMSRVRGYAILQQNDPQWRIFDKGEQFLRWLNSDEGKATLSTVVTLIAL